MTKSINKLDDVFEEKLKQHEKKVRRNNTANTLKKKKEEIRNTTFQRKLQDFIKVFLSLHNNSPKFAEYLKQHTIVEQDLFSHDFVEENQEVLGKMVGLKSKNKKMKLEDNSSNKKTVRYSLACISQKEEVSAPMLGFSRTVEDDVYYHIQIVRKYGVYECGLYRLTTNSIGEEQFHEVAFFPQATAVMKKLMNPKTFMETVITHDFPEKEL